MKEQEKKITIDWEIVSKSFRGELSDGERERMEAWLAASPRHREFYERARTGRDVDVDGGPDDRQVALWKRELMRQVHAAERRRRTVRLVRRAVAAAAVLVAGVALALHEWREPRPAPVSSEIVAEAAPSSDAGDKVVLVLSDGEKIGMSSVGDDSLRVGEGALAKVGDKKLVYDRDTARAAEEETGADGKEPETNKVITSTGGFYTLVLSDGTRVWLNSESELEYPVAFGGGERLVRLKGEAFFEVARDTARPFIVEAADVRTRVLGTSFDVKAYPNEPDVATTLFTGRVEVAPLRDLARKVVLSPGRRAEWNVREGNMRVREADLRHVAAWKEGLFIFKQDNIEKITRQIERWYGVRFVYEIPDKENYTFNGYFSRDESLDSILELLSYMGGLEFDRQQDTIRIMKKVKNKLEPPGK